MNSSTVTLSSSTTYNAPVLKSAPRVASIEFQLIENTEHGIIGRLFIPNELSGVDSLRGATVIWDSSTAAVIGCNHKSRTILFTAPLDEYKRLLDAYTNSNLLVNITRTVRLLRVLEDNAAALEASFVADAYGFDAVPTVRDIDVPLKVVVAPVEYASLAQLKGCRSSFLKGQLRQLNVYGRSKLSTIASMAEVLVGRVAISDLPK